MTLIPNISIICSFFAAGFQSLFPATEDAHVLRHCVIAEPQRRNHYRLSGSDYTGAPILPCYRY